MGIFEVTHKPYTTESETEIPAPNFQMKTLQRLLGFINGRLDSTTTTGGASSHRLSLQLQRGFPVLEPKIFSEEDESTRQPFPNLRLAREPTLEELAFFAEKLRGLKATFYASSKSSFAHHLTSYLTAWGMDVSHIPTDGCPIQVDTPPSKSQPSSPEREGPTLPNSSDAGTQDQPVSALSANDTPQSCCPSFIIIDDDVAALQARLLEIRMQTPSAPVPVRLKRPHLVPGQRTRSTPSVPRAPTKTASTDSLVILHFTNLVNFKVIKDIMQASFPRSTSSMNVLPEVIVVPKPAGPRRFLTALYTAITKPLVDPFFHPIATSPMSPAGQAVSPFFAPNGTILASDESTTPNNDKSTEPSTSPTIPENLSNQQPNQPLPPSPLAFDDIEYFSKAARPFGGSASSGLLIQSPDGRPAGIFFDAHPKPLSRSGSTSRPNDKEGGLKAAAERRRSTVLKAVSGEIPLKVGDTLASLPKTRAPLLRMPTSDINQTKGKAAESRAIISSANGSAAPGVSMSMVPPGSEQGRERTGEGREKSGRGSLPPNGLSNDTTAVTGSPLGASLSVLPRVSGSRRSTDQKADAPTSKSKKGGKIVPPISVLIVEGEESCLDTYGPC
jgi:osomolarity two-component system response regulator SSK1